MPPVGYDITAYFGRGGIVHTMTEPGSWAPRLRPAMGDHTAALALLSSVLAALRLVERTGVGQAVDVSLLATAAWTMATDLAPTLVDRQDPPAQGRRARPHALHGAFKTADDGGSCCSCPSRAGGRRSARRSDDRSGWVYQRWARKAAAPRATWGSRRAERIRIAQAHRAIYESVLR